jgi:hypothetical protein
VFPSGLREADTVHWRSRTGWSKRGSYSVNLASPGGERARLERTDEAQIALTDPDSRAVATHTKVGVGYNVQVAVDAKNNLIVELAVANQVVDMGLLTQTAERARVSRTFPDRDAAPRGATPMSARPGSC